MEQVRRIVKEWFATANEDLRSAQALFDLGPERHLRVIPYLCQQTAEKSVKGFMSYKKIKYTTTHDIGKLATLILPIHPELEEILQLADELTDYAIQFRYPDAVIKRDPTLEDSIAALRIAKQVYQHMTSLIPFGSQWDL